MEHNLFQYNFSLSVTEQLRTLLMISTDSSTDNAEGGTPSFVDVVGPPPDGFTLRSVGVGAGSKDFVKHPNILRILIGECD